MPASGPMAGGRAARLGGAARLGLWAAALRRPMVSAWAPPPPETNAEFLPCVRAMGGDLFP
jgi:hypothetical protein